jgi:DNA-binding MarR family transcriptional regulator
VIAYLRTYVGGNAALNLGRLVQLSKFARSFSLIHVCATYIIITTGNLHTCTITLITDEKAGKGSTCGESRRNQPRTRQSDERVAASDEDAESRSEQIFAFIKTHPGAHFRQIKRELNLAMGVVQYHLYKLEREKRVASRRRGLYKRFYPNLTFGDSQLEILDVLSQETERDLLLFLIQNPDATQTELSEYGNISPASINWHMRRLTSSGLIEVRRDGTSVRYLVKGSHHDILELLQSYHPMVWEKWADRLADALMEVSQSKTT